MIPNVFRHFHRIREWIGLAGTFKDHLGCPYPAMGKDIFP